MAPPAQEVPRVSEGSGSAQGRVRLHMQEPGVEAGAGERESPQMDLGAQVDSHPGSSAPLAAATGRATPQPGSAAWGFARAGVCNQKVQRPFH